MKLSLLALATALSVSTAAEDRVPGFDISRWQEGFDFKAAKKDGAVFGIIKATEGTYYKSKTFSEQWTGATDTGLIRGAYHFAIPSDSSGAEQAKFFLENGGGWEADGRTLPGMIDFEKGPDTPKCFDMSYEELVEWTKDFSDAYFKETGRYPMIFASSDWWEVCTGDSDAFIKTNPLVLSQWGKKIKKVPGNWGKKPTIWQYNKEYPHGGDSDYFFGTKEELKKFAGGELHHSI